MVVLYIWPLDENVKSPSSAMLHSSVAVDVELRCAVKTEARDPHSRTAIMTMLLKQRPRSKLLNCHGHRAIETETQVPIIALLCPAILLTLLLLMSTKVDPTGWMWMSTMADVNHG